MLYTIIMAGGSGTRFWPLSRRNMPKQAMAFLGGRSLFERALERVREVTPPENTFVITTAGQAKVLMAQAPALPRENIISEPVGRDSAAAVLLGAAIIAARDPEAVILVKPADHIISPVERFHETLYRAVEVARRGKLVTFGVTPTRAATGYGYIERGAGISGVRSAYEVIRFHEKPNLETAQEYLKDERFYWNSGMFVWRAQDVLQAAEQFSPRHFQAIAPLGALFGTSKFDEALGAAYEPLEKISIDYAVMEKAPNIATVEADFEWNDVGSPVALKFCVDADADGNVRKGLTEAFDSSGCILLSSEDHLLAAVGCEDLVVIHTPDATLVCPAERAQEIKNLVSALENRDDLKKYL